MGAAMFEKRVFVTTRRPGQLEGYATTTVCFRCDVDNRADRRSFRAGGAPVHTPISTAAYQRARVFATRLAKFAQTLLWSGVDRVEREHDGLVYSAYRSARQFKPGARSTAVVFRWPI